MSDAWQVLRRGGLPLGMPDPADRSPSVHELAAAVQLAIASNPIGRSRDALSAFVLAWRHQWPQTFERVFGDDATVIRGWAEAAITDPNRHIKLSRIAMAHLSHIL